jgi:prepilin-type N-terminal cleavage/methylation domain-containing protein
VGNQRGLLAPRGFTLVELLAVIAIIAILMGLLIPAVHSVRESGRMTHCKNNLRQIATACGQHEQTHGFFPGVGSNASTGDPDRGFGRGQPGSWLYQILPYIEQMPLWELGIGATDKSAANAQRAATVISFFVCPGRGGGLVAGSAHGATPFFARTDYGASSGQSNQAYNGVTRGFMFQTNAQDNNGAVVATAVDDGLSNVFLCGERSLNPDRYALSQNPVYHANHRGWTSGVNQNSLCQTTPNGGLARVPFQDTPGVEFIAGGGWPSIKTGIAFGSPHPVFHMAMGDTTVRGVSYTIDQDILISLSGIDDGGGADVIDR